MADTGGVLGPPEGPFSIRSDAVDALPIGDLSRFFNPFLRHFMREALRSGGEVQVSAPGGTVDGIFLYHPLEREGSIFTRARRIAESFVRPSAEVAVYWDEPLAAGAEPFAIYSGQPAESSPPHRFAHPVRVARPEDGPAILGLMQRVYGRVDARWIETARPPEELAFVVELEGQIVGVGWANSVGRFGRLHSLTVAPEFRRIGVGSDLFRARVEWLRAAGVTQVISEIAERNVASRRIADAGGLEPIGRIFRSPG